MTSQWEQRKQQSKYHFDNFKNDARVDKVIKLGKIKADYSDDVKHAIKTAIPITWKNYDALYNTDIELVQDEDINDYGVTNLSLELSSNLKKINELFALDNCTAHLHVQKPGEVCSLQLCSLEKWAPTAPWTVMRIQVAITDWEQGHFCSYGNYLHQQWHAGEVTTCDWQNIPRSTANAGHTPRITFQLTGVVTEKTTEFLKRLSRFTEHELNEKSLGW